MAASRSTLSISLDTRPALVELNENMAAFFRQAAENMAEAAEAHEAEATRLRDEMDHDSPKHPFIPEVPAIPTPGDLEPLARTAAQAVNSGPKGSRK